MYNGTQNKKTTNTNNIPMNNTSMNRTMNIDKTLHDDSVEY